MTLIFLNPSSTYSTWNYWQQPCWLQVDTNATKQLQRLLSNQNNSSIFLLMVVWLYVMTSLMKTAWQNQKLHLKKWWWYPGSIGFTLYWLILLVKDPAWLSKSDTIIPIPEGIMMIFMWLLSICQGPLHWYGTIAWMWPDQHILVWGCCWSYWTRVSENWTLQWWNQYIDMHWH